MCSEACCGKPITECHCGPECKHCDCHAKNKLKESARIGGAKKGFDMGLGDALDGRPKKNAEQSFGPYAKDYYAGYKEGQASNDHNDWQEKTAAKRQGNHYHESKVKEDMVNPKATPKDYLEVASASTTPEAMVSALEKKGKDGTITAAKAALARHKEKNNDKSLNESLINMKKLAGLK